MGAVLDYALTKLTHPMTRFPQEFSQALRRAPLEAEPIARRGKIGADRLRWFAGALRPAFVEGALELLEGKLAPHLRVAQSAIPAETITGMTENYTEALPKTLHNRSAMLNNRRSAGYHAAEEMGLVEFLQSASLRAFAERVSGFRLEGTPGLQAICYHPGDYVGPHNDHHPEEDHLRDGYVDLQITLCNSQVEKQYLVYEHKGWFNRTCEVSVASGISVSVLPFWHQVTPLVGKSAEARRWLLLTSFLIERG
jgi:hypothetical protein